MPGGGGRPGINRSFRHILGLAIRWNRQPDTRFTKSSHPYLLPDGTKIAEDYSDLTDGLILHPINIDPTGKPLGVQQFWTGTKADGTTAPISVTCTGWKDPLPYHKGMSGQTNKTNPSWSTMWSNNSCRNMFAFLLCFQQ